MLQVKIGEKAPDFCLLNDQEEEVCLKNFAGKWLILYFYPKDNTPGCTTEAKDFTTAIKKLGALNAAVVGISGDSCKSHQKFILKHSLMVPLLSDPDHKVLEEYGIWQKKKMYGKEFMGIVRSTVLIDPGGVIKHVWEKVKVKGHALDVIKKIRELKGS